MFDLDEINLMPSNVPDKPETKGQDAHARAKAIECGAKWKCTRVKAWVDLDDCVKRYAAARADKTGDYQPCLECSSIVMHLRNIGKGLPGPMSMQSPAATAPKFEPKPLPEPKQEPIMSKPAKKGTPDPIQQEAKAEPKLEIVTKSEKGSSPASNPFAGWDQYSPNAALRGRLDVFASFSASGVLSLSVAAQEQINLQLYSSVDVLHADGKLGLRLHPGKKGALAIVAKTKNRSSATVSGRGFLRQFKLESLCGKRFTVREIAPGFVEIDLKSEVAA